MDTSAWKELTNAKQYALDLDTVRAVKNKRTSIRQFVFKGEMKRKPEKQIPPVLIKGAPAELLPLGDKFKNGEHVNLSKILPYLNPDYLDFESEKYVVKYEEITKCLPRNQTQKRQTLSFSSSRFVGFHNIHRPRKSKTDNHYNF